MHEDMAGNIRKARPDIDKDKALEIAQAINLVVADRRHIKPKLKLKLKITYPVKSLVKRG